MKDELLDSLISTAQYELFTYPHWTLGFRIMNLARRILNRWPVPNDRLNWPIGIMAKALIEVEDVKTLAKYADKWADRGARFFNIDDALAAEVFIYLFKATGGEGYKMAADEMWLYLKNSRKDSKGSLVYRPNQDNNIIAADMIGLTVPFLVKYGVEFGEKEAIEMAYTQISNYLIYGIDESDGLPVHAYEADKSEHLGLTGWGRAVGWIMSGMAYFLKYAGSSGEYSDVKNAFDAMASKVMNLVMEDGLFSWHLPLKEEHVDTSASAIILDSLAMVYGVENEAVKKGIEGLKSKIVDGTVQDALCECKDYGVHMQYYGAFPWALGPTLSLLCRQKDHED